MEQNIIYARRMRLLIELFYHTNVVVANSFFKWFKWDSWVVINSHGEKPFIKRHHHRTKGIVISYWDFITFSVATYFAVFIIMRIND